ncbi:glycosyl hydrolase [Aquiflexum sp.]|uniref:glycosyl hydrolase n=1 Tax=Aquiflexum sp. TaxID=1872584 RepID=UPI003594876A
MHRFDIKFRIIGIVPVVLILFFTFFQFLGCTPAEEKSVSSLSEEEFRNPSKDNRPLALWTWLNGYVDTTQMVFELEQMKDKGTRGALIWDLGALMDPEKLIPGGPAMLGDESLKYFSLALATGKRLDLDLGWVAASSWNAGGEWVEEEHASKELVNSSQFVEGPSQMKFPILEPTSIRKSASRNTLITTVAVPFSENNVIDFSKGEAIVLDEFSKDGKFFDWNVPPGKWEVLSFFISNTGQELVVPSPNSSGLIIDHLSKDATKNYFDSIFNRLASITSPDKQFKFFMHDSYEVWEANDWSPLFLEKFQEIYGYDSRPYLPLIQTHISSDDRLAKRFLHDYTKLISDMMIENHFAQSTEIAEKHGIEMIIEAGHGGNVRVEPLKALGNSHIPMGEFWNRQRHWVTKEASSAAHIYGKKIVASESLTGWNHWQHGPTDFKQLIDIAFCDGLNQIVFHTFSHNPKIAGKPGFVYHAGEHINVNATWWEMARPFMDYIARCSYMLRQGNFVADVLLYYGDEAPNLVPPRRLDPNYTPDMPGIFPTYFYDESKCPHCGRPKPINPGKLPGYQYDYINEDIITTTLGTENGNFVLPHGQSYKILVLPDREDISLEVLKRLERLIFDGAVVIGRKPERSTSLKGYPAVDAEISEIAEKIWGDCDGKKLLSNKYGKGAIYWGKTVQEVLDELAIPPDFEISGTDNHDLHIDFVHRVTDNEDIFFISNSSTKQEKITAVFRVDQDSKLEIWDAETGLIQRDVNYTKVKNGLQLELTMDPLASRFVIFRKYTTGKNDDGLYYDLQKGLQKKLQSKNIHQSIDLSSQWNISFDPDWGGPKSIKLDRLISWSDLEDEGANYYSGAADYTREFSIEEAALSQDVEAIVSFENVQEMAQVFVNGKDCGIVWLPPYSTRITPHLKVGKNMITVKVINTWNNRIVGDLRNPGKTHFTQTNAKSKFTKNSPLLQSGLMGKAEIKFITK